MTRDTETDNAFISVTIWKRDYCVDHYPCLWLVSSKGIVTWMSYVVLQPFAFIWIDSIFKRILIKVTQHTKDSYKATYVSFPKCYLNALVKWNYKSIHTANVFSTSAFLTFAKRKKTHTQVYTRLCSHVTQFINVLMLTEII